MVAKLVKEFVLVFFLVIYSISCWLLLLLSLPTLLLVCEGELVGPPFPEIDYVSDDVGIERSIMLEEFKPKMDSGDAVVKPEIDHGDEHAVVPKSPRRPVTLKADEEDRLALASAKFNLCCLQANVDCPGTTTVCLRQRNGGMKMQTKSIRN
jgi:hypothetical protein